MYLYIYIDRSTTTLICRVICVLFYVYRKCWRCVSNAMSYNKRLPTKTCVHQTMVDSQECGPGRPTWNCITTGYGRELSKERRGVFFGVSDGEKMRATCTRLLVAVVYRGTGGEGDNVNIWTAEGTRDERKKSAGRTTREYVSREYTSTTMGERGGGEQWTCRIYPPIDDYIIYSANRRLYIGV